MADDLYDAILSCVEIKDFAITICLKHFVSWWSTFQKTKKMKYTKEMSIADSLVFFTESLSTRRNVGM